MLQSIHESRGICIRVLTINVNVERPADLAAIRAAARARVPAKFFGSVEILSRTRVANKTRRSSLFFFLSFSRETFQTHAGVSDVANEKHGIRDRSINDSYSLRCRATDNDRGSSHVGSRNSSVARIN